MYETWLPNPKKENKLKVFEIKLLKRSSGPRKIMRHSIICTSLLNVVRMRIKEEVSKKHEIS